MKKIIQQILSTEREAEAIQRDADRLQAQLDDLRQKEERIKEQSMEHAKERLAKRRAALEEELECFRAATESETVAEEERLEEAWRLHHAEQVDQLYRRIVEKDV